MSTTPHDLANRLLGLDWTRLSARERRILEAAFARVAISRDVSAELHDARTLGERVADRVAQFGGSWTFILLFFGVLAAWAAVNTVLVPRGGPFDPYPFIFLNLLLSMLAAIQAPIIMMSQNRQAQRDRVAAEHDYEVNLKAEVEIRALHDKLDALRERQWAELVALQQEQIRLLTAITERAALPALQRGE